jgi:hypothetical protein
MLLMIVAFATSTNVLAGPPLRVTATSPAANRPVDGEWADAVRAWLGPVAHWYRPVTIRLKPRPAPGAFSMNLFSPGDFVHQQTEYWCVAAAVQTMSNIIIDGAPDRSRRFQERLHFMGRRLDREEDAYWREMAGPARWRQGLHGLGLDDWTGMLNARGHGPYGIERAETRKQAIRMAARAIRLSGKPVGLVVWRGAHAWVMSGFRATADPAHSKGFTVKRAIIQDPWYPDVSSIWGASRPPGSRVPVAALAEDYLPYDRPGRRHPKRDGKFLLILPTLPQGTQVR